MQSAFYALTVCLFSIDWLADVLGILPHAATYFIEFFAAYFAIAILYTLVQRRRVDIDNIVLIVLSFLVASYTASIIINELSPGVLIGGVRGHLKFLPFFLLPMVYHFSDEQIRKQLYLLFAISIFQTAVAFYQRFVAYATVPSGDPIGGTLGSNSSGALSVWMACVMAVFFAFYLTKRSNRTRMFALLVVLVAPMMLNETKISFFLIPMALIIPAFFSDKGKGRIARLTASIVATLFIVTTFVYVYEIFNPNRPLLDWMTGDEAKEYVYKGTSRGGERRDVKRLDSIRLAYKTLDYENSLAFGLGPGNMSPAFERRFEGEYFRRYQHYQPAKVQVSASLWETGLIGTSLLIMLTASCGYIAYRLASSSEDSLYRPLAIGWICVTVLIGFSFLYFATFIKNLFGCLFWFYSGVIVAEYARQKSMHRVSQSILRTPDSYRTSS